MTTNLDSIKQKALDFFFKYIQFIELGDKPNIENCLFDPGLNNPKPTALFIERILANRPIEIVEITADEIRKRNSKELSYSVVLNARMKTKNKKWDGLIFVWYWPERDQCKVAKRTHSWYMDT